MAVQINFTSKDGNSGNYVNFDPILQNKTTLILRMKYWKDLATRQASGAVPMNDELTGGNNDRIVGFKCVYKGIYDLASAKNIFDQVYDYLKTLPEFNGAVDC